MQAVIVIILCVVASIFWYGYGYSEADSRTRFKIVTEPVQVNAPLEDKYILNYKGEQAFIYPIMYETQDVYILSRLYQEKDKIKIDYEYQMIIDKNGVVIQQVDDVYAIAETQ